jgi:hypothetical protein
MAYRERPFEGTMCPVPQNPFQAQIDPGNESVGKRWKSRRRWLLSRGISAWPHKCRPHDGLD